MQTIQERTSINGEYKHTNGLAKRGDVEQTIKLQINSYPIPNSPNPALITYRDALFPDILDTIIIRKVGRPTNEESQVKTQPKPEVEFPLRIASYRSKILIVPPKELFEIAGQWDRKHLVRAYAALTESKTSDDKAVVPERIAKIIRFIYYVGTGQFREYDRERETDIENSELLTQIESILRRLFKHKLPHQQNLAAEYLDAAYAARMIVWQMVVDMHSPKPVDSQGSPKNPLPPEHQKVPRQIESREPIDVYPRPSVQRAQGWKYNRVVKPSKAFHPAPVDGRQPAPLFTQPPEKISTISKEEISDIQPPPSRLNRSRLNKILDNLPSGFGNGIPVIPEQMNAPKAIRTTSIINRLFDNSSSVTVALRFSSGAEAQVQNRKKQTDRKVKLSEREKAVLELISQGMTQVQLAERLEITIGNLRVIESRARKKLAKMQPLKAPGLEKDK